MASSAAVDKLRILLPSVDTSVLCEALDNCCGDVEVAAARLLDASSAAPARSAGLVWLDDVGSDVEVVNPVPPTQIGGETSKRRRLAGLPERLESGDDVVITGELASSNAVGRRSGSASEIEIVVDNLPCLTVNDNPGLLVAAQSSSSHGSLLQSDFEMARALAARQRRARARRRLREARDAVIARELARLCEERERIDDEQAGLSAALALQAAEGSEQSSCRFCNMLCLVASATKAAFCQQKVCTDKGKLACDKLLACGHPCCGMHGESQCDVPCCQCGDGKDQSCGVCLDKLSESPAIRLGCGHCMHMGCAVAMIENLDWRGRRVSFAALNCPSGCGRMLSHPCLADRMAPFEVKRKQIERNVVQRAVQDASPKAVAKGKPKVKGKGKGKKEVNGEEIVQAEEASSATSVGLDLRELLSKYIYYECFRCREPYCGGLAACEAGAADVAEPKPEEVQCPSCMLDGSGGACPKHGAEFMAVKCDFCCSEALFRCGGGAHYCQRCHGPLTGKVYECDPAKCPMLGRHPKGKTTNWAMGCAACRGENIAGV